MKSKGVPKMQPHAPLPQKHVDILLDTFRKLDIQMQSEILSEFKNILRDRLKAEEQQINERVNFMKETSAKHNL